MSLPCFCQSDLIPPPLPGLPTCLSVLHALVQGPMWSLIPPSPSCPISAHHRIPQCAPHNRQVSFYFTPRTDCAVSPPWKPSLDTNQVLFSSLIAFSAPCCPRARLELIGSAPMSPNHWLGPSCPDCLSRLTSHQAPSSPALSQAVGPLTVLSFASLCICRHFAPPGMPFDEPPSL